MRDAKASLDAMFAARSMSDAVIHCRWTESSRASLSQKPLAYYDNNITGTLTLCDVDEISMGVKNIVFSSSATVYGDPAVTADYGTVPQGGVHQSVWTGPKCMHGADL